jgi:hypothetical protein
MNNDEIYRERLIDNIKRRIVILVDCISQIRTLSAAIAFYQKKQVIYLIELNAVWDIDRRPILEDGIKLIYIDYKNFVFIDSQYNQYNMDNRYNYINVSELTTNNLKIINEYMELMVVRPATESIVDIRTIKD